LRPWSALRVDCTQSVMETHLVVGGDASPFLSSSKATTSRRPSIAAPWRAVLSFCSSRPHHTGMSRSVNPSVGTSKSVSQSVSQSSVLVYVQVADIGQSKQWLYQACRLACPGQVPRRCKTKRGWNVGGGNGGQQHFRVRLAYYSFFTLVFPTNGTVTDKAYDVSSVVYKFHQ
jgi:hypothetical protein